MTPIAMTQMQRPLRLTTKLFLRHHLLHGSLKASAALFHGFAHVEELPFLSPASGFTIHEWDLRLHHMYAWMLHVYGMGFVLQTWSPYFGLAQGVLCVGLLHFLELVPPPCTAYFTFFCLDAFDRFTALSLALRRNQNYISWRQAMGRSVSFHQKTHLRSPDFSFLRMYAGAK